MYQAHALLIPPTFRSPLAIIVDDSLSCLFLFFAGSQIEAMARIILYPDFVFPERVNVDNNTIHFF